MRSERGVSLIETLVVLAMTGVLAGIAVPMMGTTVGYFRLSGDARSLSNAIAVAKIRAAADFTQVRLYVDVAGRSHRLETWDKTNAQWTVEGGSGFGVVDHNAAFLVCTRHHESSHTPPNFDDGYGAVDPSGTYRGAYQFSRSTWNNTAVHVGRLDLVGVDPAAASVADQDLLAWALYQWQGTSPWLGRCAGV